jgi:hypothetical protein
VKITMHARLAEVDGAFSADVTKADHPYRPGMGARVSQRAYSLTISWRARYVSFS